MMLYFFKNKIKKITPKKIWDGLHWGVALAAAVKNKFPSREMVVIGVTGTNGKSTVVQMAHDIFSAFGLNVASASTVRFRIKNEAVDNKLKMTMPGRFQLQNFLRRAADEGCQYVILEVTSEGLKQHRAAFINFDAAVFTNLRPEHIESHGSFENYREAKARLFKKFKVKKNGSKRISVLNLDDPSVYYYANFPAEEKIGYGLLRENGRDNIKKYYIPEDIKFSASGVEFNLEGEKYVSTLLGDFNLYNILAAVALARAFGIPHEVIKKALHAFKGAPGRLEVVQKEPFLVVVDYAHTPDALESVYRVARSFWAKNGSKLIAVLGATGGGRDKWKRPQMGAIAEKFCDEIILTDEDPYTEDPEKIIRDVSLGIKEKKFKKILDRRLAIREALRLAKKGDVVLMTGKGGEKTMMTRFGPIPWDEKAVVLEELGKLKGK